MADSIVKFFKKLTGDSKFNSAGPGYKLTDSATTTTNSQSSKSGSSFQSKPENVPVERSELSETSKMAAEAALARMQQKKTNPSYNTTLTAVQAQVKRELAKAKASTSKPTPTEPEPKPQTTEENILKNQEPALPKNYAASAIYYKCPMISPEVLSWEEWKQNIRTFLYDQLDGQKGLTACLIIQSCNTDKDKIEKCVETLCKYLENIVTYPEVEKFQKIRTSNRAFCERVRPLEGAMEFLEAAGFMQMTLPSPTGGEEEYLVFDPVTGPNLDRLISLIESLRMAVPIPLELDRNLRVLSPSQGTMEIDLPDSFYDLNTLELKKEQLQRGMAIEKMNMLRTKSMRDKDEIVPETRKYKFGIIRIRFPDGFILQGTFSVDETFKHIHEFVEENLEHNSPFLLHTPTGDKLSLEEDGNKTLNDLKLVPAIVLTFARQAAADVNDTPNKNVYLKSDIMLMVRNE